MPRRNRHASVRRSYFTHMLLRGLADPDAEPDSEELTQQLVEDLRILERIKNTRYLRSRTPVAKSGNLHLAFEYSQNPADHDRFLNMLRVSPQVFHVLLGLIEDNPVFFNNSNNPQTPVEMQLAVTLFRMGRFGNGASLEDIARTSGFSEGSVLEFTDRCFDAIEALHDVFVRPLSAEEKEAEKRWMVNHLGYDGGLFKEGWVMYDGQDVQVNFPSSMPELA